MNNLKDIKLIKKNKTITIDGNEYNLSPWSSKQQKDYLKLKSADAVTENKLYDILIKDNVIEDTSHLSSIDLKFILTHLSIISISETVELKMCKCTTSTYKIEEIMHFDCNKEYNYLNELDNLEYEFQKIPFNKVSKDLSLIEQGSKMIENSIKTIKLAGEEVSFDMKELKEFLDDMPSGQYSLLVEAFNNSLNDLYFEVEYECSCDSKTEHKIEVLKSLPNILW